MFSNSLYDSSKQNPSTHWKAETGLVEVALAPPEHYPSDQTQKQQTQRTTSEGSKHLSRRQKEQADNCASAICCIICLGIVILVIGLIEGGSGSGEGSGGGSFVGFLRHGGSGGGSRGGGGRGGGGGGSCFPAGQGVLVEDSNQIIAIESLVPGTEIQDGGKVTALMKLRSSEPMYRYNESVFVTGSHLVHEFGEWKAVQDSRLAAPVESDDLFVYNMITENHSITINSTLFKDWEEWEDTVQNWELEKKVLNKLNHDRVDCRLPKAISESEAIGEGAFAPDTPILMDDLSVTPIELVQPGDILHGGAEVFSVMQLDIPTDTVVYEYHGSILTEWTIVFERDENIWRNVRFSPHAKPIVERPVSWYQLWTTNHRVPVQGNLLFADYHVIDEDDPIFAVEL